MGKKSVKQQEVLAYIGEFLCKHGYAPTVREIGNGVGLNSTATVVYHLDKLQKKGMLVYESGKKRAITLSNPPLKQGQIPVVGVVTAGMPILAVENREGTLNWDGDPDCFALRVRGDSMIDAGIFDGDLVVVRPQQNADDGQIVVAMIEDEATVKTLRRSRGMVWLQPENPAYSIIQADDIQLVGLVKAVVRYY